MLALCFFLEPINSVLFRENITHRDQLPDSLSEESCAGEKGSGLSPTLRHILEEFSSGIRFNILMVIC